MFWQGKMSTCKYLTDIYNRINSLIVNLSLLQKVIETASEEETDRDKEWEEEAEDKEAEEEAGDHYIWSTTGTDTATDSEPVDNIDWESLEETTESEESMTDEKKENTERDLRWD